MIAGVPVFRCSACSASIFPEPLLCPRCHGPDFQSSRAMTATVEQVSTIHHMAGRPDFLPRKIASVKVADGPTLIVGLLHDAAPESAVELFMDGTAPVARPLLSDSLADGAGTDR